MPFTSGLLRDDAALREAGRGLSLELRLPWMRSLPWSSVVEVRVSVGDKELCASSGDFEFVGSNGDEGLAALQGRPGYWVIGEVVTVALPASIRLGGESEVEVGAAVTLAIPYIGSSAGPLMFEGEAQRTLSLA